jgi:hypothetical protein
LWIDVRNVKVVLSVWIVVFAPFVNAIWKQCTGDVMNHVQHFVHDIEIVHNVSQNAISLKEIVTFAESVPSA